MIPLRQLIYSGAVVLSPSVVNDIFPDIEILEVIIIMICTE